MAESFKCAYNELVELHKLIPNPKNANNHPEKQIELLAKIIDYQGQRSPIVVSKRSGFITKGHGRLLAIQKLGWSKAAVDFQEYESEAQEFADLIADNKIAELAEHDDQKMFDEIKMLPDLNLEMLGIPDLVLPEVFEPQCDPDDLPEKVDPKAKYGDVYKLGNHRLMCGDSTNLSDVEKLMAGEKADLWLTDPPYGVSYKSNRAEDKHLEIQNDSKPIKEMYEFWKTVAGNALIVSTDQCPYYWFACQGGDQMMMMMSVGDAGWKVRHELIWKKDRMVLSRCDYHYQHEPILYGWKTNGTHNWYSDRKQVSVLEFARPKSSDDHPTMKPVELIEYLMNNSSKTGDIVLDTFNGSGTTLIACEKNQRKARAIEIEPIYVDRTIARWEKFTGKKAELIT